MQLVVDSNVLFTYFWKKSFARNNLMSYDLYSPVYALEEINKHKIEIIRKTQISLKEFKDLRMQLAIAIEFIPVSEYKTFLNKALRISPDTKDVDFFALALRLKLPIWSNDRQLKDQKSVIVLTTRELLDLGA